MCKRLLPVSLFLSIWALAYPAFGQHDADLVGAPVRLVVGDKSLREGKVEVGLRSERERRPVAVADAAEAVRKALETFN